MAAKTIMRIYSGQDYLQPELSESIGNGIGLLFRPSPPIHRPPLSTLPSDVVAPVCQATASLNLPRVCEGHFVLPSVQETPAEKKARDALERVKSKEMNKKLEKAVKTATLLRAKAENGIAMVTEIMSKPQMDFVASSLKEPLVSAEASLNSVIHDCDKILTSGPRDDLSGLPSPGIVSDAVGMVRKTSQMLTTVIAAVARARSS